MDADTLRLILIVAGSLFLGGLYIWERRRARPQTDENLEGEDLDALKREPQLGPLHGDERAGGAGPGGDGASGQPGPGGEPEQPELHLEPPDTAPEDTPAAAPRSPLILSFHITPKEGAFPGEAIVHAASECGLEPGEMEIFHRYRDPGSPTIPLFSVANMVKPGTFPFGAMSEFESPGLTLFSQAEGASDDLSRLEDMLAAAHCMAGHLEAEIRDDSRTLLTPQVEDRLRERVLELVTWRLSDTGRE
jgi:cell division protein ZipA